MIPRQFVGVGFFVGWIPLFGRDQLSVGEDFSQKFGAKGHNLSVTSITCPQAHFTIKS
jgi:hypothetical protein